MASYSFSDIERKWQRHWSDEKLFRAVDDFTRPKFYVLDMFPYPSGTGLHVGHPLGYVASDIVSRFKRMCGFNVLHPMGFDSFGLPTERQAMKENVHPANITARNIDTFREQLDLVGFDYDWSRTVTTSKPEYYKWTQWIFLLIYNSWYDHEAQRARPIAELPIPNDITDPQEVETYRDGHRLTFVSSSPVNWCEELGTVLANEEVDEWKEKGYTVERRPMRQWMMRITAYAERLIKELDLVEWPSSTIDMQRHWIGRSEGAEIRFDVVGSNFHITVFTTRPDTLTGATYMVLAPEHPLVPHIVTHEHEAAVLSYKEVASFKSDLERTELAKVKTGVFTGAYAVNPATNEHIPIWIADYVLAHYGTGAIMAVPAHDERDHEFATTFGLPIVEVEDVGPTAITRTISWLVERGIGRGTVQYRLRDWLFARQRYWGEPIPIMFFDDGTKRALDLDELPLTLPEVKEFKPSGTGESPLAAVDAWMNFTDAKTGKHARLETNTMPQWAGSCWYYLRYIDPQNDDVFVDPEKMRYWLGENGVDLYIGGGEHSVLHLLYARFWHKILFDYGLVSSPEPFKRLFHQGMLQGTDGRKMSKSLGNTVTPDEVVSEHGADALRMYLMFLGPLEASKPWSSKGLEGIGRYLNRVWRLIATDDGALSPTVQNTPCTGEQDFVLHTTIAKIREDIDKLSFNTAVAQLMIFVNEFTQASVRPVSAMSAFVQCLAPFAPHLAEELWSVLGNKHSVFLSTFPTADPSKMVRDEVEIVIQINSKIRGKLVISSSADAAATEAAAKADATIAAMIEGKEIRRAVVVPGKLVNFIL
ncbi:MAG: class I tRNA ligase family protein [bacterium]|nr:class I tRNA ligase family protein [bacterium]